MDNRRPSFPILSGYPARSGVANEDAAINTVDDSNRNGDASAGGGPVDHGSPINVQTDATEEQKQRREWTSAVPSASEAVSLEAELNRRQKEFLDLESQIRERRAQDAAERLSRMEAEQASRRKQYEDEDKLLLEKVRMAMALMLVLVLIILHYFLQ
jgi:hypothetical protein